MRAGAGQVHARSAASIGLSLEDEGAAGDMLLAGEVASLRAGVEDMTGGAICSAMVLIERDGHQVLWGAGGFSRQFTVPTALSPPQSHIVHIHTE